MEKQNYWLIVHKYIWMWCGQDDWSFQSLTESYDCQCYSLLYSNSNKVKAQLCEETLSQFRFKMNLFTKYIYCFDLF